MIVSNSAPMLGARCANYGYRPWTNGRQTKPRPWVNFERRIAKIAEYAIFTDELDEGIEWHEFIHDPADEGETIEFWERFDFYDGGDSYLCNHTGVYHA